MIRIPVVSRGSVVSGRTRYSGAAQTVVLNYELAELARSTDFGKGPGVIELQYRVGVVRGGDDPAWPKQISGLTKRQVEPNSGSAGSTVTLIRLKVTS
jgi:hypothetical protein